jgi:Cu+-exporting ATPase
MSDPLGPLPFLVRLSRETVRIIRQNIVVFAFGVNAVGIVLTAWVWPLLFSRSPDWVEKAPLAAVIYHQFGSLAVLLNSMRLLWFERGKSNAFVRSARSAVQSIDRWMARLDPHEASHWLADHARGVGLAAAAVLIAAYALSGFVVIGPAEVGLVKRFGRAMPGELDPGLHWRWPWPVDQVVRLEPDRVRAVEIGFRTVPGRTIAAGYNWSSAHADGVVRLPDEGVVLTGDGNLIELQATVRYALRRGQLARFAFEVADADAILRPLAESVLRTTCAGRPFNDLLTTARADVQSDVLKRLDHCCEELGPAGLGIQLVDFTLHDVHPPQEVVPDYHRVIQAIERREIQVNQAHADTLRVPSGSNDRLPGKRAAEARSQQIVAQAEAATYEQIKTAEAQRARFLARQKARANLSVAQEWRLLQTAAKAMQRGQAPADAFRDYQAQRERMVATQVLVTDFRLYWDALSRALGGREKVLIDADKVPGRRHLLLTDPDQLLPMLPIPALPKDQRRNPRMESSDEMRH